MLFSVIIPLYNRPQEIKELLETLTLQTYREFEVLVLEDGSVNDAADIVKTFEDKLELRYFVKKMRVRVLHAITDLTVQKVITLSFLTRIA